MTRGTQDPRETATEPTWRRYLLPVYAFVIALALTAGAGSLAAVSGRVPAEDNEAGDLSARLSAAQSELSAARETISELQADLADSQASGQGSAPVIESQEQAPGAQNENPGQQPPQPGQLIVRIRTAEGAMSLPPDVRNSVLTQWLRNGAPIDSRQGVPDNGEVQISTTDRPDVVCVNPTRSWRILQAQGLRVNDPTTEQKPLRPGNRSIPRVMCVDVVPTQSEITFTLGTAA